jgi:hypothetical protein
MAISDNTIVARLTAITLAIAIGGSAMAWLDSRHASASDVSMLRDSIDKERLSRIEFEIDELERTVRGIMRTSAENQNTPMVKTRLMELKSRGDRYLRKREELLIEMEK